ncbi:hypothetical protein WJX79_003659 [Trebouxia sp. C0005]
MGANRWLQTFGQCHLSAAYSPSAFEITILRTVPSDQRNVAEIAAIAEYGTYASPEHYNLTPGGGQRPTWDPLSTLREYGHTNKPALLGCTPEADPSLPAGVFAATQHGKSFLIFQRASNKTAKIRTSFNRGSRSQQLAAAVRFIESLDKPTGSKQSQLPYTSRGKPRTAKQLTQTDMRNFVYTSARKYDHQSVHSI